MVLMELSNTNPTRHRSAPCKTLVDDHSYEPNVVRHLGPLGLPARLDVAGPLDRLPLASERSRGSRLKQR